MNSAKLHENPFIYGPSVAIFNNCMGPSPKLPMGYGLQTKAQFGLYDPHMKQQEPEETTVAAAGEREERRGERGEER